MFNKLVLALCLLISAAMTTACGGGGGTSTGPYVDVYVHWTIYDDPWYDPWYDPYYDPYYCYSCWSDGGLSQKDLAKMTAQKQSELVGRSAEKIQMTLGLSAERSQKLAKLALQIAKAPKGSLTDADYDNFSKEILGSSAKEFQSALKKNAEGDAAALDLLIDRAAAVNGVGPEHARKILRMFN